MYDRLIVLVHVVLKDLSDSIWQSLDEAHSSPGLHAAAGPGLAEECATLVSYKFNTISYLNFKNNFGYYVLLLVIAYIHLQGGCRTGMAKITNAYDLPARFCLINSLIYLLLFCLDVTDP